MQYGQEEDREFYTFKINGVFASSWIDFPSTFKYVGFEITLNLDSNIINRQTYSVLDWLGDIGGLNGILLTIAEISIAPFASFELSRYLLLNFFRTQKRPNRKKQAA